MVEILSPGNTKRETKDKFDLYQNALIPEYWLIDPDRETVIVYSLHKESAKYVGSKPYMSGDHIQSEALTGFSLEVATIFY